MSQEEEQKAAEKEDYAGLDIDTGNRKRNRESHSQEKSTRTAEEESMSEENLEEKELDLKQIGEQAKANRMEQTPDKKSLHLKYARER